MSMASQIRNLVEQMIKPTRDRVFMLIARGVIDSINDSSGIQGAKVCLLADEVRDTLERIQEYGFTSTPLPQAECVVIFPGGNRDHGLVIAVDDRRVRPKDIPPGGAAIYSSNGETLKEIIKVLPNGTIELGKGTLEKIVNGETFLALFNAHKHLGNAGVPTGGPIVPMVDATDLSQVVKASK